jgi:hypothetical protein
VNIRKACEDARDAGMIRANIRIPDLLAILDERDRYRVALEQYAKLDYDADIANRALDTR